MKKIFLDMDGVLCDFEKGYTNLYNIKFASGEREMWTGPLVAFKRQTGRSAAAFWGGMGEDFWANLDKTPECDQILEMVEEFSPVIISAPPLGNVDSTAHAVSGKVRWIRKHLPSYFFTGRFFIGFAKHHCASGDSVLIDDRQDNCIKWEEEGGQTVLVPRPWNAYWDLPVVENIYVQLQELMRKDW